MSNPIYEFQPPADEAVYIPWPGASGAPVPASGRSLNIPAGYRELRYIRDSTGKVIWAHKWRLTCAGNNGTFSMSSNDPAGFKQVGNIGICKNSKSITVTAVPNEGYRFSRWSDGVSSATRTITMDHHTGITAEFVESRTPIWMTANSIGAQAAHTFASNAAYNYIYELTNDGWKWNHYANNWVCGYKVAYAGGIFVKCQQPDTAATARHLEYSIDGKTWKECTLEKTRSQTSDISCVAGGVDENGKPFFIAATNWYSNLPGTIYYTKIADNWNPESGLKFTAAKYGDARSAGNNDSGMSKGKEIAYNGGAGNICFDGCAICPNTGICAVLCPRCNEIWLSNDCGETWLMFHSECESGIVAAKDRFLYRKSTNRSSTVKSCLYDSSKWKYSGTSEYAEEGLISTIQLGGGTTGGQLASYYVINVGYSHETKRLIVQCLYDPVNVSIPDEYITFYIDLSTNDIQEDSRSMMVRATSYPTGFGNDPFEKIWYGNGMFMAITKGENPVSYTSTNGGVTWTGIHSPGQDDYGGSSVRVQDLTFGYVYRT